MYPPYIENSKLELLRTDVEGGNDIAYLDGRLYIISAADGGSFRVCTAAGTDSKVLGELHGLGNMRQIEVSASAVSGRMIAAVTARECGLYIIDATDPAAPYVCCHYDSVEFGTGVAFCGKYVAVGCRSYGVELIDISVPEKPRHVSVIRAGEVQSVCFAEGILYTGSWGERQVNVFDVNEVSMPKKLATIPLEGRGDGLVVRDGILFAATGQHLRPATGTDPEDYGFGRGNGFVIWDVHDPANPVKLSATMLPVRFLCVFWDMWDVNLCGNYAVVSNSIIGVWIYDISDLTAPVLKDHIAITTDHPAEDFIPILTRNKTMLPFDREKQMYAPVTGVAAVDGMLYVAARFQKLSVAKADYFIEEHVPEKQLHEYGDYYMRYAGDEPGDAQIIPINGQAHAAAYLDGKVYAACGNGGLQVFGGDLKLLNSVELGGFVLDVRVQDGLLYIAAGFAGLVIMRPEGDGLVEISRLSLGGASCAQVVPSANGRFVMAHTDDQHLTIIDVTDKAAPRAAMLEHYVPGLIYHRQISRDGVGGRYYGCYWNNNYTRWYDLSGDVPILTKWKQGRLGFRGGVTGLADMYKTLAVVEGGYVVCDIRDETEYADGNVVRIEGARLRGKPVVSGNILYVTNRLDGDVAVCDISDASVPKLVSKYNFSGHPDMACPVPGGAVIPLGHQGLAYIKV